MRQNIIKIDDNGSVTIQTNVAMTDFEIAQLLGVMLPTVKGVIKRLLKTRYVADCSGGIVHGNQIIPEYFGLNVVIYIAFQVDSRETEIFRQWILKRIATHQEKSPQIFIQLPQNQVFN